MFINNIYGNIFGTQAVDSKIKAGKWLVETLLLTLYLEIMYI